MHIKSGSHLLALVIAVVAAVSIPTLAGQDLNPKFNSREKAILSFSVLTPKIETSGKDAGDKFRVQDLTRQLQELVFENLKKAGFKVAEDAFSNKALEDKTLADSVTAVQSAYDALSRNLHSHPKDVTKGAFSLGEPV